MTSDKALDAILAYASSFHKGIQGHHVASPLGLWLLLALLGPGAEPGRRAALESALGMPLEEARAAAAELLDEPHEAVKSAVATWVRGQKRTARLGEWEGSLPGGVDHGEIPSQEEADQWARENTRGIIESFPVEMSEDTLFVLASALAAKVSWDMPFDLADGSELGGAWGERVKKALRAPHSHHALIVSTEVGQLGVHVGRAAEGVMVVSGIGPEDASSDEVLKAVHEVAHRLATDGYSSAGTSLFDLPLGEGHSWTITEKDKEVMSRTGRAEKVYAVLPAWEAKSNLDLVKDVPHSGVEAGLAVMMDLLDPEPEGLEGEAKQVAKASYTRTGFEAAAVTAMAVAMAGMMSPQLGKRREAHIRFHRGYGVVAVALDREWKAGRFEQGPWHGVPVFSAWVEEPGEAE